jgi:threonine/homoserine/homoserine lactone efflux protein
MNSLPFFVPAVIATLAAPGPTNALLFTSAGVAGFARSLRLVPATILGYLVTIGMMQTIGGPLITAVPSFGLTLRIVLVLYLLLLAWRLWHADSAAGRANATVVTFGHVFLTTLLNPKGLVFAFAIFPPADRLAASLPYAGVFAVLATIVSTGWIGFGAAVRRGGGETISWALPRVAAVFLCAMGAVIAGSAIAASL